MSGRPTEAEVTEILRAAGARFAFVFGSVAAGTDRPDSDLDVAAWWRGEPPAPWKVGLDLERVDLLVLNTAPLELAGRVALHGRLLLDDDPPARVRWQVDTRIEYLDHEPLQKQLDRIAIRRLARGR